MKIQFLVLTLFFVLPSIAQISDSSESWNGDLIAEPTLADYSYANRAPGILVEPYDIIEVDSAN